MKKITPLLLLFLLVVIFRNWIFSPQIIGGDWPYFYQEKINTFSFFPPVWNSMQGNGYGGLSVTYALDTYLYFTGWLFSVVFDLPWVIVYKIFWFGLFLCLTIFSSYRLQRITFPNIPLPYVWFGSVIYITNTYILMVVGGGQMGVALGYAMAPLVLLSFIKLIDQLSLNWAKKNFQSIFKLSAIAGLYFAIQVMFDFRIAYITIATAILYLIFSIKYSYFAKVSQDKQVINLKSSVLVITSLMIPLVMTILLHAFWLSGVFINGTSSITQQHGAIYTTTGAVKFFSFATLENALGLLHPNWPENLFGKISFMKPEFLLLPILAYSSLLFINYSRVKELTSSALNKKKKTLINNSLMTNKIIIYFALLGIIGAFLVKGANEPFGGVYLWIFEHVPGFIMFRDPTKWYILISLSYSVLIPFVVWRIYEWLKSQQKYKINTKDKFLNLQNVFILLIIFFILYLIHPALFGQLGGTFRQRQVPNEYISLKEMLVKDSQFSRTLWLPKVQRFGYIDQLHPAVEGTTVLNATNSAEMIKKLQNKNAEKHLADLSIKYIVVPYDSEQEIFLKDRKFNVEERDELKTKLDRISWLQRNEAYSELLVYTIDKSRDRFWMLDRSVSTKQHTTISYDITVGPGAMGTLIFNESYSPYWIAINNGQKLIHKKYGNFNSYDIPSNNKTTVIALHYTMLPYAVIGRIISLITLIAVIYFLLINKSK